MRVVAKPLLALGSYSLSSHIGKDPEDVDSRDRIPSRLEISPEATRMLPPEKFPSIPLSQLRSPDNSRRAMAG